VDAGPDVFDAIRAGDGSRLAALLAQDRALASARNDRGHSPVLIAQYHHRAELVAMLLAADPELDVFDAASVGRTDRVAHLLDQDPALLNAYSSDGFFPLALAAFFGHPDTVQLLLARGADIGQAARNPMRLQALHAGVASGSVDVVRALAAAGGPVNAKQQGGWAPLHEAVNRNNVELVRCLLTYGADPRQQNDEGKSAIGLAADKGYMEILKLLKMGA
jgi:ankyrin repeat protein